MVLAVASVRHRRHRPQSPAASRRDPGGARARRAAHGRHRGGDRTDRSVAVEAAAAGRRRGRGDHPWRPAVGQHAGRAASAAQHAPAFADAMRWLPSSVPSCWRSPDCRCCAGSPSHGPGGRRRCASRRSPVRRLVVGLLLPDYVVRSLHKRHLKAVERGLPDALDMLVICSEAGLGLEPAHRTGRPRDRPRASGGRRGTAQRGARDARQRRSARRADQHGHAHRPAVAAQARRHAGADAAIRHAAQSGAAHPVGGDAAGGADPLRGARRAAAGTAHRADDRLHPALRVSDRRWPGDRPRDAASCFNKELQS